MKRFIVAVMILLALPLLFVSCGGGGGGNGGGGTPRITGTIASGAALAGATITVKDSSGNSRTSTTANDGTYSIDSTGLTSPFLLLVTTPTKTLYSVSADANTTTTINATPLTDLIIRSWYDVKGVSMDAAFANPASNPPPTPSIVAVISDVVKNMIQLWLNQAGVTQADFNLISTPFSANGTGIDQVLDNTTVDTSTGQVTISGGGVTQTSLITAGTGSINIVTTTTDTSGTSTSTNGTVVPVETTQQTALDGITTTADNFASAVNAKSATLAASDLLPFLDPTGLYSGLTYTQWAGEVAYYFKGKTISFSRIAVKSLDTTNNVADVVFQLSLSKGGQTSTSPMELFFRKVSGTWLLSGNARIADVEVRANMVRNQGSQAGSQPNLVLEVNVDAPRSSPTVTSLSSAAITGGPWSSTTLTYDGLSVAPWDATQVSDSFGIYATSPTISGGQLFSVVLTQPSGSTTTYTQTLNAITTEPIMITNLTGSTIADAHLGSAQTVTWTLPKTFAISQIRLGTVAYTGVPDQPSTYKCDDMGEQAVLGITSTTASVTIPAKCGPLNQDTVQAEIYLQVYGVNGELTTVYYTYQ